MKKIFPVILSLGMMMLFVLLFQSTGRTTGYAKGLPVKKTENNEIGQNGPAWYDEAWHYRVPIIISSNSISPITNYRVLVELNSVNFNFNLAKADGSDIRLTDSTGTTLLYFWKESWDIAKQRAYIWVLVSSLFPDPFDTIIYLYYNNSAATSASNGTATFEGFEDNWTQFGGTASSHENFLLDPQLPLTVENLFIWTPINGTPTISPQSIANLAQGIGIKSSNTPYQYYAMAMSANFTSTTGHEFGGFINGNSSQRTVIEDQSNDLYLKNYRTGDDTILIPRVNGKDWHNDFHVYELKWNSTQSKVDVDHGASTAISTLQIPDIFLPVTLFNDNGSNGTFQIDWVYVRQYRDPEPTALLGAEQGLVDLNAEITDSPDPINTSTELTYILTVFDNSIIDAPGVVVTDTLPSSVTFISAIAPLGCSNNGLTIVCNLGTILAHSSANATIKVKPNNDGILTNSAVVGSPGYDPYLGDNYYETTTLVDSVSPTVEWLGPTTNRNIYFTSGGWVTLKASAQDSNGVVNSGVNYVEFWRYPDIGNLKIATVYASPYEIPFNTDDLIPNIPWPFEVFAFDHAGNRNVTDPPIYRQVIYIERISSYFSFLPISTR